MDVGILGLMLEMLIAVSLTGCCPVIPELYAHWVGGETCLGLVPNRHGLPQEDWHRILSCVVSKERTKHQKCY